MAPQQIQRFLDEQLKAGLSHRMVQYLHAVIWALLVKRSDGSHFQKSGAGGASVSGRVVGENLGTYEQHTYSSIEACGMARLAVSSGLNGFPFLIPIGASVSASSSDVEG
jgi:hypothetical protein